MIKISQDYISKGQIDKELVLFYVIAWRLTDDKP